MGIINYIEGKKIYLDTNIFIYALEAYPQYIKSVKKLLKCCDQGEFQAITSELTLAEVLVKPMLDHNLTIQKAYQEALQNSEGLNIIKISRDILIESARLRSITNLRLPDAIHAATAIFNDCQTFVTNDKRLKNIPNLKFVILDQIQEE